MIIDGQRVPFDGEKNVLAVIRKAGIDIPTFCYYSELSTYGACRMCMVEDVKTGKLDASCSMEPRDGMEIRTNTAKLLKAPADDPGAAAGLPRLLLHHLRQERQLPFAGAGTAVRRAAYPLQRHAATAGEGLHQRRYFPRSQQVHSVRRLRPCVRGIAGTGHTELCLPGQ